MTDTFRALCAELVHLNEVEVDDWTRKWADVIKRTKAALGAQPEPQGLEPTDDELQKIADALRDEDDTLSLVEYARAVLARHGRPAIEPVPKRKDVHYAWELHDAEGEWQAGGSANSLEDVQRESNRYLQTYSQDGPHKLIIERHCVTTIEPVPGVEGADA